MGRIILEVAVVFVVYCLGFTMGFRTCADYVADILTEDDGEE
mgnify:CR=1 FL=1